MIVGPRGSGKSHLAEIWREASGAKWARASELDVAHVAEMVAGRATVVEDLHDGVDEGVLFHLLNLAREREAKLLLTSRLPIASLPIALPDLTSRLRALNPVELSAPDDDLLHRLLAKLFADRQLAVDPGVIDYIVVRIERSFAAAGEIVSRLDAEGLAEGRAITRQFAGEVVDRLNPMQGDLWPEEGA